MIAALAYFRRYHEHDQARFPLATLILLASERSGLTSRRLLDLAEREATSRGVDL